MLSILSIAYLAVLAGCAAAAVLTAVIFLARKKAGKPLALYAVCVLALLGLGVLASMNDPVPNPRHTEPERTAASPGTQNPPIPWAIAPKPVPAEPEPADIPDEPELVPAPIAGAAENVPEANPVPVSAAPSKAQRPAAPVPAATQTPSPAPEPAALSAYEPVLGGEPQYTSMSNPELAGESEPSAGSNPDLAAYPEPAAMSNPELWDDGVRPKANS